MKQTIIPLLFILQFLSIQAAGKEDILVPKSRQISADTMGITISQNSNYLLPLDNIVITVQVSNFELFPELLIESTRIPFNNKGVAVITKMAGSVGTHKIPLVIKSKDSRGEYKINLFTIEYEVGQSWTIIAEENFSPLYIGVENPISIFSYKIPLDQLKVQISGANASISKSADGLYVAKVQTITDKCFVDVYGNGRILARKEFRVVYPPNPILKINGKSSGSYLSKADWSKTPGFELTNNDTPFPLSYVADSFTLKIIASTGSVQSFDCTGSEFSSNVKQYLAQVPPGSILIFDSILVHEQTTGRIRLSPSVFYTN